MARLFCPVGGDAEEGAAGRGPPERLLGREAVVGRGRPRGRRAPSRSVALRRSSRRGGTPASLGLLGFLGFLGRVTVGAVRYAARPPPVALAPAPPFGLGWDPIAPVARRWNRARARFRARFRARAPVHHRGGRRSERPRRAGRRATRRGGGPRWGRGGPRACASTSLDRGATSWVMLAATGPRHRARPAPER